jgi:hypothetical protein
MEREALGGTEAGDTGIVAHGDRARAWRQSEGMETERGHGDRAGRYPLGDIDLEIEYR